MTNSLKVGQVITSLLNDNSDLTVIKDKIYPIIANDGTTFPFVIYKRTADISSGCKDGYYEDEVEFEIDIVSEGYAEGIDIAQLIRTVLERQKISTDLMVLYDTHITNAYEEYTDNVYIQKLNFITKIN